jgi:L-glutamine-phosphate cytidylyltransferase
MIKQAIILAAGQGSRLGPHTENLPKCLLDVGGKTIVEHQVEMLTAWGVEQVAVVIGYLGHKVREALGAKVRYFENSIYQETSSMYSLWLAREVAEDGFLVINSDVLFHGGILKALLDSPHPDALAVDFAANLAEEEMKVRVKDGRVRALSKKLLNADAENVGMIKFCAAGSQLLFAKIAELLDQGLSRVMVPYAVNAIASGYPLAAVPVQGLPWIEIDFPEDYQKAREVVFPAIVKDQQVPLYPSVAGSRR